jgi:hypothetical protein
MLYVINFPTWGPLKQPHNLTTHNLTTSFTNYHFIYNIGEFSISSSVVGSVFRDNSLFVFRDSAEGLRNLRDCGSGTLK